MAINAFYFSVALLFKRAVIKLENHLGDKAGAELFA